MQHPFDNEQQAAFDKLSFYEREAIVAASLGDLTGVTARPVGYWAKNHYVSVPNPLSATAEPNIGALNIAR